MLKVRVKNEGSKIAFLNTIEEMPNLKAIKIELRWIRMLIISKLKLILEKDRSF